MKAFRGTLFSDLLRIASRLEEAANRREAAAVRKVEMAKGGKAVDLARKELRAIRKDRKQLTLRSFRREVALALTHYRVISEREIGGDTHVRTIEKWVELELPHTLSILLMSK